MASPPSPRKNGTSTTTATTPGPRDTDSRWIDGGDDAVRVSHHRSLFESLVRRASTLIAPEVEEKGGDVEDFEQLAKKLEDASSLEIMDKALEKFGNGIAIAFR